ncbi:MAG: tryptophan--tRNA ligase [Oscillospiraceae bacterium]|jgi:tryptophanyl-tRNA synthetase|nr:tryptophan--tRNA ligase [Oscillospiraceae bacterium]
MKQTILSGIQPSGILTLGNYLGALRNWVAIQNDYDCKYFIADLHSITVTQDPKTLHENIKKTVMQYLACGLDPDKNTIFIQSHVHEHAELGWILNNSTYMGEMERMTQFKDKSAKQKKDSVRVGLFDYPVLMAADILLYDADLVPVGEDQRQHLEITRTIARRFNSQYGDIFKIPEGYISEAGARIMSLQDPSKKMSKSDSNPNAYISLLDAKDVIIKKFKKAVTDSENVVRYSSEQPGVQNLINIYSCITGKTATEVEKEFEGAGYGTFKVTVGEAVADTLAMIQAKYEELNSPENEDFLKDVYAKGAERARLLATPKLRQVYEAVGFIV